MIGQIEQLRKFLKSEVATRKETEMEFERVIERRTGEIVEAFNVGYLNGLYEMRERMGEFEKRKAKMEMRVKEMKARVEEELMGQEKKDLV